MAGSSCCTWRKFAGFTKWSSWVLTFLAIIAIVVIVTQHQVFHQVFGDNAQIPEVIKDVSIGIMSTTTLGMLSGFWHQHAKRNEEDQKAIEQRNDGDKLCVSDSGTITTKVWGKSRFWSLRYFLGCAGLIAAAVMLAFFMPDFITYGAKSFHVTMPLWFILTAGVGGFLVLSTMPFNSIYQDTCTVTVAKEDNMDTLNTDITLDKSGDGPLKVVSPSGSGEDTERKDIDTTTKPTEKDLLEEKTLKPVDGPPAPLSPEDSTSPKTGQPTTKAAPQKDAAEDDVTEPITRPGTPPRYSTTAYTLLEEADPKTAAFVAPSSSDEVEDLPRENTNGKKKMRKRTFIPGNDRTELERQETDADGFETRKHASRSAPPPSTNVSPLVGSLRRRLLRVMAM